MGEAGCANFRARARPAARGAATRGLRRRLARAGHGRRPQRRHAARVADRRHRRVRRAVLRGRPRDPRPRHAASVPPVTGAPLGGGIIAAGEGSRLRADGFTMPKPLVPISGVTLIEHALRNMLSAGVRTPVVIVNEQARECVDWVRHRFSDVDVEFIVKTTRSSLESFLEVSRRLPPGRSVISTVDAWCPPEAFARFVANARQRPPEASVLAVTTLVADEKPLWVNADQDGLVETIGGDSGRFVTAGIYMLSERVRAASPPPLPRLRDFLAWLLREGEPFYAESIEAVVDIDRASDVALAETLQTGNNGRHDKGGEHW